MRVVTAGIGLRAGQVLFPLKAEMRKVHYFGGFVLEKCCHHLDIYNMVTASRPRQVVFFGGRKSCVSENAPLKVTARNGHSLVDNDHTQGAAIKGTRYGADTRMWRDITKFLRGQAVDLPGSVLNAMQAGIAALGLDPARENGTIVDLSPIWEKFDSYGLRA